MNWVYDDGGRAAAGYKGSAGDCGVRAIAIAVGHDYAYVYDRAFDIARHVDKPGRSHSPRDGFSTKAMHAFMAEEHWKWTPTMSIGSGTQVHLRADELNRLVLFYNAQKKRLEAKELDAAKIAGAGNGDIQDIAAWTLVARAIMNLDEFITKE